MRACGLMIAAAACSIARSAAADCTRPTDPGGALGYTYGSAAVQSFGSATVRVWYTAEGPHAVNAASSRSDGVPDDVAQVAQVTSDALASYAAMGYRPPVSDAATPACGDDGGDGRLDVYLVHMTGGDGTTVAEPGRCTAVGSATVCASYILAMASFAGLYPSADIGIHTVLPHEVFHAVQNAYDAGLDRFWAEGTAQWAAKLLDPSLTDLERFLPAFFNQTARSLDAPANGVTSAFLYGAAIWPVFLAQRHGDDLVRRIFDREALAGGPALAATDVVLAASQSALATEYPAFAAWNAATGTRAGRGGYAEAAMYPMAAVAELTGGSARGITSGFASYYFHVSVQARAMVSLEPSATRNAGTLIPLVDGVAQLDAAAPLPATLAAGEAIVVVSGTTANKTDAPFSVAVTPGEDGGCAAGGRAQPSVGLALLLLLTRRSRFRRAG